MDFLNDHLTKSVYSGFKMDTILTIRADFRQGKESVSLVFMNSAGLILNGGNRGNCFRCPLVLCLGALSKGPQ